jgi:hypothetical protein
MIERQLSQKARRNRMSTEGARASEVTITRMDGSVEVRKPYSPKKAAAVIRKGRTAPRTWEDRGPGRYGGGNDFST